MERKEEGKEERTGRMRVYERMKKENWRMAVEKGRMEGGE